MFVLPTVGQPRFSKRIETVSTALHLKGVFAFQRDYHKGSNVGHKVELLGELRKGRYIARLNAYLKALLVVRKSVKDTDIIYLFGSDLVFLGVIACIFTKCQVVVEVGDIRPIQTSKGVLSRIYRCIERLFLAKVGLLVVTSEKFKTEFFQACYRIENIVVVENKVQFSWYDKGYYTRLLKAEEESGRVKIGYFGLLRCAWSANCLYHLLSEYSNKFELVLAGFVFDGYTEFQKLISLDNVLYLGEYKNPEQVSCLYNEVDIVWGAYKPIESSDYNLKWARTNRFYEATVMGKPLILREGSQDGVFGKSLGNSVLLSDANYVTCAERIAAELPDKMTSLRTASDRVKALDYTTKEQDLTLIERLLEI